MKKNPTKKLVDKIIKIPGISEFVDPKKMFNLSKKEGMAADLFSAIVLSAQKDEEKKSGKRRQFSESIKKKVKEHQKNKCKSCGKKSKHFDFDHIDGNKSNNDITNCQALCLDCHADKNRKKEKEKAKKLSRWKKWLAKKINQY